MHFLRLIKHKPYNLTDKNQYQYLIYIIFQYIFSTATMAHKVQEERERRVHCFFFFRTDQMKYDRAVQFK